MPMTLSLALTNIDRTKIRVADVGRPFAAPGRSTL